MNYYKPRERKDGGISSGIWHYTVENDGRVRPIGGCADGGPEHDHATPEEATECFRQWALRERLIFEGHAPSPHYDGAPKWCAVDGCAYDANDVARITAGPYRKHFNLCAEHATREAVTELLSPASHAIASW